MPEDTDAGDELATRPTMRRAEPDAYGQAALLLAESILHVLVERRLLTSSQALIVVRAAAEVKVDVAEETGESAGRMEQSIGLLARIERSLMTDANAVSTTNQH